MAQITIGERRIGSGWPCFIIAEAGVNHNGDLRLAEQLIEVAVEAGADAVKFQSFVADRLVTAQAQKAAYQLLTTDTAESHLAMLRKLELSRDTHVHLLECARRKGITFLSTPFDEPSADLLEKLGVPLFKIPSGELTNLPFLKHVANKRKPMIISTGMSTLEEVQAAVQVVREAGCELPILLHCTSSYPAEPETCNLRAMQTLRQAFGLPVGYSDHTRGIDIAAAAVALGACALEKHLTLSHNLTGPDHQASLEPDEFKALVKAVRNVEMALGDGMKRRMASEENTMQVARKSLVAATDLPAGTVLQAHHLTAKRPGVGVSPAELPRLIGRTLSKPLRADELISWTDMT